MARRNLINNDWQHAICFVLKLRVKSTVERCDSADGYTHFFFVIAIEVCL